MSEENTQQDTEKEQKEGMARGPKGELGTATPALQIRQMWHEACFKRIDTSDRAHPNRKTFMPQKGAVSLKAFARKLAKEGDPVAKSWLANKLGASNQKRSDKNATEAKLIGAATKTAKRKKKDAGGGGGAK